MASTDHNAISTCGGRGDWKQPAAVDTRTHDELARFARICGWPLALGHARSGDPDRERQIKVESGL